MAGADPVDDNLAQDQYGQASFGSLTGSPGNCGDVYSGSVADGAPDGVRLRARSCAGPIRVGPRLELRAGFRLSRLDAE